MEEEESHEEDSGYPRSEIPTRYGAKPYHLEHHEHSSLIEIRKCLKKEYEEKERAEEHLGFLEELYGKLNRIMINEEREKLHDYELELHLSEISTMCKKLTGIIDSF